MILSSLFLGISNEKGKKLGVYRVERLDPVEPVVLAWRLHKIGGEASDVSMDDRGRKTCTCWKGIELANAPVQCRHIQALTDWGLL